MSTLLSSLPVTSSEAAESKNKVSFSSFVYEGRDRVWEANPPRPGEFYNPVRAGFYADPCVCRAGNDFYLINSSFSFFPGVPISHSTDLVNWKTIGYVLDRPSQLPLDGQTVSEGIFAPAISYHDGLFYMVTTNIAGMGNFYVTAKNPAGPWSEPIPLPRIQGIDPSFFFDSDGRAYLVHNGNPPENKALYEGHRAVWLWEFDYKAGKIIGEGKIIVNGGVDISKKPIWIEGPHIFKRGDYYYLSAAEGGTGPDHSQVIFRSKDVQGPYVPFEGNPILTQRDLDPNRPNPITCVGHADLIEAPNGQWWAVFLAVRPYEGGKSKSGAKRFCCRCAGKTIGLSSSTRAKLCPLYCLVPRCLPVPLLRLLRRVHSLGATILTLQRSTSNGVFCVIPVNSGGVWRMVHFPLSHALYRCIQCAVTEAPTAIPLLSRAANNTQILVLRQP